MRKHPYWIGYKADENGSVVGRKDKVLKPVKHHTGYTCYTLRQNGKQKQIRAHRFVWECFNGDIPKDKVINHKDGNKENNALDNLELVTNKENTRHAFDTGLMKGDSGGSNSMSKLSDEEATELIYMTLQGYSNKELGNKFNLHPNYVSLIRHRKRWRSLWDSLGI